MDELLDALSCNFEGKENMRQTLLAAPKYGNDNDQVDWFMRDDDIKSIEDTLEIAAKGGVVPTRTGFRIGQIKVQRKGGTPDPQSLQFKW